jgi:hypothetical protein
MALRKRILPRTRRWAWIGGRRAVAGAMRSRFVNAT